MTLGKIIDVLLKYHTQAILMENIHKPFSWALYQTWKWCDSKEKEG